MASTAVDPQQGRQGGDLKQKNAPVEGRSRKVLQDIGNLVPARAAEGKPIIQYTRRAKNLNKEKVNGDELAKVGATKKTAGVDAKAKVPEKCQPKSEEVIVISSDEEDSSTKSAPKRTSGKVKKTFTSALSARSKAASGLNSKPKDPVVDIDAEDINNELAVVEYMDDLYQFYKLAQDEGRVHDYMDSQPEINAKMRSILIDWLVEVHRKFELMPETLYLTINILDRFLSKRVIPRRELQLAGISSMLIASKYEEIWAPEVDDFVCISDDAYVREQVLFMEKAILQKLEWHLTVPTPYVFLVRYVKASTPSDMQMENMAFFLAELGIMQYPTIILCSPSLVAASAVYAARRTLDRNPFWTSTLKHHTGYSEDQLMDCAKLLVGFHSLASKSNLRAVYTKYASSDCEFVSLKPPAIISSVSTS